MKLLALVAPLLFLAPGLALTARVPELARDRAARVAYAYLCGVAFVCGGLYAVSHLGVAITRASVLALAAAPLALLLAPRPGGASVAPPTAGGSAPYVRAALLSVGAFVSAGLLGEAITNPVTDYDGRVVWGAHARFVRAERSVDAAALRERQWYVYAPRHPLLVPLGRVALQEVFGFPDEDDRLPRPFYAMFFPALLVVLFAEARRRAGPVVAGITVACAVALPALSVDALGGASGAYSDFPLAALWGGGLALLLRRRPSVSGTWIAGLLLGAALLAKNEGGPLAAFALAAAALHPARIAWAARRRGGRLPRHGMKRLGPALVPVVLALVLFLSWRSGMEKRMTPSYDAPIGPRAAAIGLLRRLPVLPAPLLLDLHNRYDWGLFWVAAPLVALAGRRALRSPSARPLLIPVVGLAGMVVVAYAVTILHPIWLLQATFYRFVIQLTPALLLLLACGLRGAWRERNAVGLLRGPVGLTLVLAALVVAFFPQLWSLTGHAPIGPAPLEPPPELALPVGP